MPFTVCPGCARSIELFPEDAGKKIECAVCNTRFDARPKVRQTAREPAIEINEQSDVAPPAPQENHAPAAEPRRAVSGQRYDLPPFEAIIGTASIMVAVCAVSMLSLAIFWPLALPLALLGVMLGISAIVLSNRKHVVAGGIFGVIGIMIAAIALFGIMLDRAERARSEAGHVLGSP